MTASYRLGDRVEWDWGEGSARGEIAAIHTNDISMTIEGAETSREADPCRPAYTVKKDGGGLVLLARHEIAPERKR